MSKGLRIRMTIEGVLAVVSACLAVLTAISPDWIEELTGFEPDAGSGALEWGIIVGLGTVAILSAVLYRRDTHRLRAAAS